MPCVQIAENAIICAPTTVTIRTIRVCPACHERRRQIGLFAVWYDTLWTCLGCGDTYSCEGIHPRPFARGWRDEAKRKARKQWADAPPRAEAWRTAHEMVGEYLEDAS